MIMACPNCYYFLKGRLDAEIISVYEKMAELKIGNIYQKERIPMYYPCPDRKDRKFEYDMKPFLVGKVEDAFRDVLRAWWMRSWKRSGCGTGTDRPCKSIEGAGTLYILCFVHL